MSKKEWLLTALLCLLVAGACVAYRVWPRTVPFEQCSEVYQRYSDLPGIQASFIKDKQINDSVRVDVTLLQATDSTAWSILQDSLGYARLAPEDHEYLMKHKGIRMKLISKGYLDNPMDSVFLNNDLVAIDGTNRVIGIFNLTDSNQYNAIIRKNIRDIKNNKTKKR
ncbi:MAG: hypothetical protein IKN51_01690 [Bacteroidaceae bacterium]|nr:hypothetical protein [Bacteroidaceae bacterium]